jgi:hypothetical protein
MKTVLRRSAAKRRTAALSASSSASGTARQRLPVGEALAPVDPGRLEPLPAILAAQPVGDVRLLQRARRQVGGRAAALGLVEPGQLLDQPPHAGPVEDRVVAAEQQGVARLRPVEQRDAPQRCLLQAIGPLDEGAKGGLVEAVAPESFQGDRARRLDDLQDLAVAFLEAAPQCLVACGQGGEGPGERGPVERTAEAQQAAEIVGAGRRRDLLLDPEAPLRRARRCRAARGPRCRAGGGLDREAVARQQLQQQRLPAEVRRTRPHGRLSPSPGLVAGYRRFRARRHLNSL